MRSGSRRTRLSVASLLAALSVAPLVSACGSDSTIATDPVPTFPVDPAASSGFFMGVEMPGTLQRKGTCLVMSTTKGLVLPVWPSGYTVEPDDGGLTLFDPTGNVAAHTGQRVTVSGGVLDPQDLGNQPCLDAAPSVFEVQHLRIG